MRTRSLLRRRLRTWSACIDYDLHPNNNLRATPSRIREWFHEWRWHR